MFAHRSLTLIVALICAAPLETSAQRAAREFLSSETALQAIDEETLRKMRIDDPILREVYIELFVREGVGDAPWEKAALADLERRGSEATPLVLDLFRANPGNEFRGLLMSRAGLFRGLEKAPLLQAARDLYRDDGPQLSYRTCLGMAHLFADFGTEADLPIVRELAARSELAWALSHTLPHMERRLKQEEARKTRTPSPPRSVSPRPRKTTGLRAPTTEVPIVSQVGVAKSHYRDWVIGCAAIGLFILAWLVWLRRKKGTRKCGSGVKG